MPEELGVEALTCAGVTDKSSSIVVKDTWNFLSSPLRIQQLNEGLTLFNLVCKVGSELAEDHQAFINTFANISGFEDEIVENNVPHVDACDKAAMSPYTVVLTKSMYMLPNLSINDITAKLLTSQAYHLACQPGKPFIHPPVTPGTFRMTKTLVPIVWKMTIQFKVSEICVDKAAAIGAVDDVPPDKVMLLERTKRNIHKTDGTRKVKSLIMYNSVPGGLLVRHSTVALNSMIPSYAASLVNNLASFGAREAYQTVNLTRTKLPVLVAKNKASASASASANAAE